MVISLSFKSFFEQGYQGPGTMLDQQGIPRHLMRTILSGDVFMLGNETTGQLKINGKLFTAPIPAKIDVNDNNFHADESGNFLRGTLIIMSSQLPTQTNKVGREVDGKMIQNPGIAGDEKVVINAAQLKELLTVGLQQSASMAQMGGAGGGMGMGGPPMGGMGGF